MQPAAQQLLYHIPSKKSFFAAPSITVSKPPPADVGRVRGSRPAETACETPTELSLCSAYADIDLLSAVRL
jgi:hypothetical protein